MASNDTSDPQPVSAAEMMMQGPRRGKDAVDALLTLLSPWELIYLRTKARDITIEATEQNGFATCESLPPEILACIAQYLTPYDFLHLRRVSRGWRHRWMNYDALAPVFQRCYPGALQHSSRDHAEALLLGTMGEYHRKRIGDWVGGFVPWDMAETLHRPSPHGTSHEKLCLGSPGRYIQEPGPFPFCNEGKVACQPFPGQVVVDDLATGQRTRCSLGIDPRRRHDRNALLLVAITGKMVVMATVQSTSNARDNFRILHIYHLEDHEWKQVTLPAGLAHCYAQQEQIAATCLGGQVITSTWRGPSTMVPTQNEPQSQPRHTKRQFGGVPGVLFHPTSPNVIFLVWLFSHTPTFPSDDLGDFEPNPQSLWTTVVVKYELGQLVRQWRPVAQYSSSINHPRPRFHYIFDNTNAFYFDLSCDKMNNHGSYSIGFCRAPHELQFACDPSHEWWGSGKGLFQCFNVLSESFNYTTCSSLPSQFPCPWRRVVPPNTDLDRYSEITRRVRLWNGEVFHIKFFYERQDGVLSCDLSRGYLEDGETIALSIASDPIVLDTEAEHDTGPGSGVRWSFEGWLKQPATYMDSPQLFVDNNYIVLFTQHGYLVRGFGVDSASWLSARKGPNFALDQPIGQWENAGLDCVPLLRTWVGEAKAVLRYVEEASENSHFCVVWD